MYDLYPVSLSARSKYEFNRQARDFAAPLQTAGKQVTLLIGFVAKT